ncbi:uncharacterized protein [Centruroides vittatus]|uniref:uncharacterized protein n=1 Tax=Centruroides vittatus TaxID=120091 RepID=UPI00350EAE56
MNKMLFMYAFLGIILLYNVGDVVTENEYYEKEELISNLFTSKDPVDDLGKDIDSLESDLGKDSPNKTVLTEEIEETEKVVDKLKDPSLESDEKDLIAELNELKSDLKTASIKLIKDECKKAKKVIEGIWAKLKKKIVATFSSDSRTRTTKSI